MDARAQRSDEAPARDRGRLEFRLLGPFEVRRGGEALALGGARQRALLALLCLERETVVPIDRIVEELWGESPPATARHIVEVYVSKLRKLLGPDLLRTRAPGYVFELDPDCLDVACFECLLAEGSEALALGQPDQASARLGNALDLWRGQPLADFSYEPFAQAEIGRLADLRLRAEEERIEAELALGKAEEIVGQIEALVAAEPLRERRLEQLMLALFRAGRQADALAAYRRAREMLVDELGIEPGPNLQAMEKAILNQDEAVLALAPQPLGNAEPEERPRRRVAFPEPFVSMRWALVGGGLIVAIIAAVAIAVLALGRDDSGPRSPPPAPVAVAPNSVAVVDPDTANVIADVPVGGTPGPVVFGSGAAWVANYDDKTISRIDARTREVETLGVGVRPYGLAIGEGALWITNSGTGLTPATVTRRDLISNGIESIQLGSGHPFRGDVDPRGAPSLVGRSMPVVVEGGGVWVGRRYYSQVVKLDAPSRAITRRVRGPDPAGLAADDGTIWVVNFYDNTVWRVEAESGRVTAKVTVGEAPCCVAATDGAIWVASGRTEVWRISPRTNSIEGTVDVGKIPVAITADDEAVWVANYGDSSISRIDAQSNQVITLKLDHPPVDVAVGGGSVWVTVN